MIARRLRCVKAYTTLTSRSKAEWLLPYYAVLRNPSCHREVSFDDMTEASEAVMTASLLMRVLDRIEKRISA